MQNIKFNINSLKLRAAIAAIVFLFVSFTASADDTVTRRFGVFIGSNNGGKDRPMLRYAVSDARSVSHVFGGMGGVTAEDNVLMVEPTIKEINSRLDSLKKIAAQSRQNNQRTELIFYYSGHSDEEGLLLNREHYGYRELRDYINTVSTDMTIVILDSCSSGAITRAKGGFKTQPFLFDSSVSAEGYAFLTSSSADEASQESDTIESSYFTHSLLAGLRGAADSVGDGRVTLNELYRYAYTETLARTETSVYGAQHPSYDIQISGTGDVVLTDIKEISAALVLGEDLSGRISIRDSSDFLVAELTKVSSKPLALGLEPGLYRIMVQKDDNFYRTEIRLPENQTITLGMKDFTLIASASGDRIRGNETEINPALNDNSPVYPFNIQILPGIDIFGHGSEKATNYILTGLLVVFGNNIRGIGAAGIGLINTGYVQGLQASGVFNFANGSVQGLQTAGIFNYSGSYVQGIQSSGLFNISTGSILGIQAAGMFNNSGGNVQGIQSAGLFNYANGNVQGVQAAGLFNYANRLTGIQAAPINVNSGGKGAMFGVVNISGSSDMVPFGVLNFIRDGIFHPAFYVDDMLFSNISLRTGSKSFYTLLGAGTNFGGFSFANGFSYSSDKMLAYRAGFGFELSINKIFFDLDFLGGSIINLDKAFWEPGNGSKTDQMINSLEFTTITAQARLTAGVKIFEHLGIFGGISYDYFYRRFPDSPNPADFGGTIIGGEYGRNMHKLGFFGGIQF